MGFKKALKTLEILEKPEVIFNRRLNSNPFHPFKKVEKNSEYFYQISFQSVNLTRNYIRDFARQLQK